MAELQNILAAIILFGGVNIVLLIKLSVNIKRLWSIETEIKYLREDVSDIQGRVYWLRDNVTITD